MIAKLNARSVKRMKPTIGKRMDYHDSEVRGLTLRVTERGVKSWTVLYRHRGRLRRLTLGDAKVIGLADARERAREAIRSASKGEDPATDKKARKRAETIGDLATEYIERHAKRYKRSWREDARILKAEILPIWRQRAIKDITRRDVRVLVEAIAARGAGIMANRTTALLSKLFKFALDDELIEASPAVRITRPAAEQKRDRVLTEDELRALWKSFDALSPEMGAYFKLRALTAQRGGEVSSMRWHDVDLTSGCWTIPAERSKNGLAHRVPLSASALALLAGLYAKASRDAEHVLAGARGRRQQSEAAATFTVEDFRGHDLRRTAASLMAGGGTPRLTIGKILNHVERDITAVYDRHGYDAEKRIALDAWDRRLTGILAEKPTGAVVPFIRSEAR
jgi:integrase